MLIFGRIAKVLPLKVKIIGAPLSASLTLHGMFFSKMVVPPHSLLRVLIMFGLLERFNIINLVQRIFFHINIHFSSGFIGTCSVESLIISSTGDEGWGKDSKYRLGNLIWLILKVPKA